MFVRAKDSCTLKHARACRMELLVYEESFSVEFESRRLFTIDRATVVGRPEQILLEKVAIRAIFGTYICGGGLRYLVVCTESELTGCEGIFRAVKCVLVPYVAAVDDASPKHFGSIEKLLSSGTFYFTGGACYHPNPDLLGVSSDDQFLWNHALIANFPASSKWVALLMQGFVTGWPWATLISRRSVKQAGTRFNARGIDDDGNVAIFTETQATVIPIDGTPPRSFTQVRGSVPVFWSQTSNVQLVRNFEMTRAAFKRHLEFLKARYPNGPVVFVNLLSTTKAGEAMLTAEMTRHLEEDCAGDPIPVLVDFDFHKFVHQSRPLEESLTPLLDALRPFVYLAGTACGGPNASVQKGVFRVNCLDCLDRTNVVQMMLAWESLGGYIGESRREEFFDLWVQNGDAISRGYSGVGSVLSRLVKTAGKSGGGAQLANLLEHSWRSANRFIVSNWEDGERHDAIVNLVRNKESGRKCTSEDFHTISLWVGTWNVHGRRIDETVADWLIESADIVIVNVQEVIDLSASSVLFQSRGDDVRNRSVDIEVLRALEQMAPHSHYVQVSSESMVGLYMTVFVKRQFSDCIDHVKTLRVKAGFGGATGNKGAISVSFRIRKEIEIQCVNVHLDSGEFRAEERMNQLSFILDGSAIPPRKTSPDEKTRCVFIAGDFNFRCDGVDPLVAIELIHKSKLEKLRRFDPYISTKNVLKHAGFRELPLLFPPTYKYDPTGRLTDKRTPSWCDRIFFRSTGPIELTNGEYHSVPRIHLSDHKPVYATFTLVNKRISPGQRASPPDSPIVSPPLTLRKPATLVDLLSGEENDWVMAKPASASNSVDIPDLLL